MIKTRGGDGRTAVTFSLDPSIGAGRAVVHGDWNGWAPDVHVMEGDDQGGFSLTIALEPGRRYRFRYLLDGWRWENDWAADDYEPNGFGTDDSIVDLTFVDLRLVAPAVTAAMGRATPPARRATTKTAAKKAVATKAPPGPAPAPAPSAASKTPADTKTAAAKKASKKATKKPTT